MGEKVENKDGGLRLRQNYEQNHGNERNCNASTDKVDWATPVSLNGEIYGVVAHTFSTNGKFYYFLRLVLSHGKDPYIHKPRNSWRL